MANTSKTHSKNNNPFKVNILSALLSGVETEADTSSILTTYIIQTSRQLSLIYKHTRTATKEEKDYIKKRYFCKYYPP